MSPARHTCFPCCPRAVCRRDFLNSRNGSRSPAHGAALTQLTIQIGLALSLSAFAHRPVTSEHLPIAKTNAPYHQPLP